MSPATSKQPKDPKMLAALAALEAYLADEALEPAEGQPLNLRSGWKLASWAPQQGEVGGLRKTLPFQSSQPRTSRLNPWKTAG
ncbi:MAG: hypothetical protein O2854_02600 [Chloroflexi bacterium]|nr:hypothetical protein [Chloroflexota bacterium]